MNFIQANTAWDEVKFYQAQAINQQRQIDLRRLDDVTREDIDDWKKCVKEMEEKKKLKQQEEEVKFD